jgi:hypothetical protein
MEPAVLTGPDNKPVRMGVSPRELRVTLLVADWMLYVDSGAPRQAAAARVRGVWSVWAFSSLARVAGFQAASLADGDSAAMTVSAETGIENMGKS